MELCEKLKELRKKRGVSQQELADAIFVSRSAVAKWESGKGSPSKDAITALGEYLYSTQTMFIRKSSYDAKYDDIYRDSQGAPMSDTQLAFHLALAGNVKYFQRRMAVYRVFPGSATNTASGRSAEFDKKAVRQQKAYTQNHQTK